MKKKKSVLATVEWHLEQGYTPMSIYVAGGNERMIKMFRRHPEKFFPEIVEIYFHRSALPTIHEFLKSKGYYTSCPS